MHNKIQERVCYAALLAFDVVMHNFFYYDSTMCIPIIKYIKLNNVNILN